MTYYCYTCAVANKLPMTSIGQSFGPCDICGETHLCYDLSSGKVLRPRDPDQDVWDYLDETGWWPPS